jgi:hypothetical protein
MSASDHSKLTLPPIALSDLPESTKDFILAASNPGRSATDVIISVLDAAAMEAGFHPFTKAQAEEVAK